MINFNPLQSAFEAKIVFLEFKALRAHKKTISRFISTKGLFVDLYGKREKSILLLLPPNLNFVCF